MLELTELHSYYAESHVLQGVSLRVPARSAVAVLGRNGVGKTTLLHSVMGLVRPRRGGVRLAGEQVAGRSTHQIARHGVALVPQGHRIFRSLTVAENLAVPFRCPEFAEPAVKPWTDQDAFAAFPVLAQRRDQRAGSLSGGEQQMLAMARALVSGPRVLLLDEPSEGLAPLVVEAIADVIRGLRDQGMAVLLVEQNFHMALGVADRVYVMSRGAIVHESAPDELAHNEEIKARYLGM
ncbi:MAG: ABC transporter ATP-binding protein [Deferrisomatales bacterium]